MLIVVLSFDRSFAMQNNNYYYKLGYSVPHVHGSNISSEPKSSQKKTKPRVSVEEQWKAFEIKYSWSYRRKKFVINPCGIKST